MPTVPVSCLNDHPMQNGFYVMKRNQNYASTGHPLVVLATEVRKMDASSRVRILKLCMPYLLT